MRHAAPCLLVLLCGLLGCSGRTSVHPVEGRVLVDGRPAAFAQVAFRPLIGSKTLAVGVTGADGTFRLTTFEHQDGAAAGEYAVTVIWPDNTGEVDACVDPLTCDRFNGRYADPATTRLRATVRPGRNEVALRTAMGPAVGRCRGCATSIGSESL